MKALCPHLKIVSVTLFVVTLICADVSYSQRRRNGPPKAESRAAVSGRRGGQAGRRKEVVGSDRCVQTCDSSRSELRARARRSWPRIPERRQSGTGAHGLQRAGPPGAKRRARRNSISVTTTISWAVTAKHSRRSSKPRNWIQRSPKHFMKSVTPICAAKITTSRIGFFRSAIRLKPDYAEAYLGLGQVYAKQGKTELANEQLRKLNRSIRNWRESWRRRCKRAGDQHCDCFSQPAPTCNNSDTAHSNSASDG